MILRGQYPSPAGTLYYLIGRGGLQRISFREEVMASCGTEAEPGRADEGGEELPFRIEEELLRELNRYFHRGIWKFHLPLNYEGVSPLFRRIYETLRCVGPGEVVSYSELAEMAGIRRGARVVGIAMSRNPFVIIVPCHRVVGKRSLGGFSAGIEKKIWLLRHEGVKLVDAGSLRGTRRI